MSVAWMNPVTLWREPMWALVLRVALRLVVAEAFAIAGLNSAWTALSVVLWILCVIFVAHGALAVANRRKNHGVVLRLMGTGVIEWPRSYQEEWLKRPVDTVDGARIEVLVDDPILFPTPSAPHVSLRGQTQGIARVPLFRASVDHFKKTVNALTEARGVVLVDVGTAEEPPRRATRGEAESS